MNNWLRISRTDNLSWRSHLLISLIFIFLLVSLLWSLDAYWRNTLQPRLYQTAETQATIFSHSQTAVLVETLQHSSPQQLTDRLFDAVQEILIVTDPAIGERMVEGISLEIDYDVVTQGSSGLNFSEGIRDCEACFRIPVALINDPGELMGVATFMISDQYYQRLTADMQSQLFRQSSLVLVLLLMVWLAMLIMFHRLNRAKHQIEASDRAKTRFIAGVTHELRTPLNAILGYTQMYQQDEGLPEAYQRGIDSIDRSAEHLLLLINDILDFSKVDEDSLTLHPQETHLPRFLHTLVEMSEVRAQMKGLNFICDFPPAVPLSVLVDEKRLRQVLLNLLSNAVKFTETGEVCFELRILSQDPGHIVFRFAIRDTGIGIAPGELRRIFIPFQQLDNHISRAEGSGLGLTISQKILRLLKSELKVSSEPGQGSEFWFVLKLPVVNAQMQPNTCREEKTAEEMQVPERDVLNQLIQLAGQHNILALRQYLSGLEAQGDYAEFTRAAGLYLGQYRFRPMTEWLIKLRSDTYGA